MSNSTFVVGSEQSGVTLAAFLRSHWPGQSWTRIRRQIETRHIQVGGQLCVDPARRLRAGEQVELAARPAPAPRPREAVVIRYLDEHLVVVEKPADVSTVRHPLERDWPRRRKTANPTLEDLVALQITRKKGQKGPRLRLRIVQRLDKETSGLVVFARTVTAESGLGRQFRNHSVIRRYLAIVRGEPTARTVSTRLVRDRGDGRRGSTTLPGIGKEAVTHIQVIERLGDYTLIGCRLQTGRTHQIRIHLAELGHPICGEKVYNRTAAGVITPDRSRAPRLALHAGQLGFVHPVSGRPMDWTMPLPADLQELLIRLRSS
jgi:23S rRNA pseudouridine1911/1915/1917 synthase